MEEEEAEEEEEEEKGEEVEGEEKLRTARKNGRRFRVYVVLPLLLSFKGKRTRTRPYTR